MADDLLFEPDRPLRRRRGPAPRLYVIARQSPVPWVQVRRLGTADREALTEHMRQLNPTEPRAAMLAMQLCAALDFSKLVGIGAFAGNAVVAAALGIDTAPRGAGISVTVLSGWRGHGLQRLVAGQVTDAPRPATGLAAPLRRAMAGVLTELGGRMIPTENTGLDWVCWSKGLDATG